MEIISNKIQIEGIFYEPQQIKDNDELKKQLLIYLKKLRHREICKKNQKIYRQLHKEELNERQRKTNFLKYHTDEQWKAKQNERQKKYLLKQNEINDTPPKQKGCPNKFGLDENLFLYNLY